MSEALTTILLIRHGHTAVVGERLVGRLPGVRLSEHGAAQARRLAGRLAADPIAAVYSSPLERATQTAAPLARQRALDVRLDPDLIEVDFGAWTGKTFAELYADERWQRFNTRRASAEVPGGEPARAVQSRVVRAVERLASVHRGQTVVAFSHADVIRAAVLHYAGVSLDDFDRFEISPASVTALLMKPRFVRFLYINLPDRSAGMS